MSFLSMKILILVVLAQYTSAYWDKEGQNGVIEYGFPRTLALMKAAAEQMARRDLSESEADVQDLRPKRVRSLQYRGSNFVDDNQDGGNVQLGSRSAKAGYYKAKINPKLMYDMRMFG